MSEPNRALRSLLARYLVATASIGLLFATLSVGCRPDLDTEECRADSDCETGVCIGGFCRTDAGSAPSDDAARETTPEDVDDVSGLSDVTDGSETGIETSESIPEGIRVVPDRPRVAVGETMRLEATIFDGRGNVLDPANLEEGSIGWSSSDEEIATVQSGDASDRKGLDSSDGLVTGVASSNERVTIEAWLGDLSASVDLKVVEAPVAGILIEPASPSVHRGQTVELAATPVDPAGNELSGRPVQWSVAGSDSEVAEVDDQGVVTGKAVGTAEVTATAEGVESTVAVRVEEAAVGDVTVTSADPVPLLVGKDLQLTAQPLDSSGTPLCSKNEARGTETPCGRSVEWFSGSEAIATVSKTGVVTGKSAGTVSMFAEIGGKRGDIELKVRTNSAPDVVVGDDRKVETGSQVQLDGSGTSDPDGDALTSIQWTFASKPQGFSGSLTDAGKLQAGFTASEAGIYELKLTVGDGWAKNSAKVMVEANTAPSADAGSNVTTTTGSAVQIDGTASTDPDGDTLDYSWRVTNNPSGNSDTAGTFGDATAATTTFTPDQMGDYTIELEVTDGHLKASDQLTLTANNAAPEADAGPDETTSLQGGSATVSLDGSGSSDPEGQSLNYSWSVTQKPDGATTSLSTPNSVNTDLTVDKTGDYEVTLTVKDTKSATDSDTVQVTVQ